MRRRREQYIPLVALCLRHFLADSIICMCVFDFRQAQVAINTLNNASMPNDSSEGTFLLIHVAIGAIILFS